MESYVFPGNIEKEIMEIGGEPFMYMRTAHFSEIVKNCEERLLQLIDCPKGKVIFYTASGTGAMDAVVTNYVSKKGKALVIVGGSFGKRWKELCEYYSIESTAFSVPFAQDIDYIALEQTIITEQPKVLLCQHHETSSGQLFNLETIGNICKKHHVSLVVDAISSFLTDPLSMVAYNIDICLTSSQKGLNIAPGLSFIILSEALREFKFNHLSYYFDFEENLKNLERGQTPFSPATTLFLQLNKRLDWLIREGVKPHISKVQQNAYLFRKLCDEMGWERPVQTPSNCVTGFFIKRNYDILAKELIKHDIYIMPGGTPGYFRVSHSGVQSEESLKRLVHLIKSIETY